MKGWVPQRCAALSIVVALLLTLGSGLGEGLHARQSVSSPTKLNWGDLAPGWAMFRGNTSLDGNYSPSLHASHFSVKETNSQSATGYLLANNNLAPVQSSPIAFNGTIYVPAAASDDILAFNASTLALTHLYSFGQTNQYGTFSATPLIANVGGFPLLAIATDRNSQQIFLLNLSSGAMANCPDGGDQISSSPTPVPGGFFVADGSGKLWNIPWSVLTGTACPGSPASGSKYEATGAIAWAAPTAGSMGPVVAYADYGNQKVDVYSEAAPATSWAISLTGAPANTPQGSLAVVNLSVPNTPNVVPMGFVGSNVGKGAAADLYAVDLNQVATPGKSLYTYALPVNSTGNSGISGSVALLGTSNSSVNVIYPTVNGTLSSLPFTLSPTCYTLGTGCWGKGWNFTTSSSFVASPVVAGDLVMDGDLGGQFYILNATTGVPVWEHQFPGGFYSSPVIYNNQIYALTSTGLLVEIAPASPTVHVAVPSPVQGGTNAWVNVTVGAINSTGAPSGTVGNAVVSLYFKGGNYPTFTPILPNVSTNGTTGIASFQWHAPAANINVSYNFLAVTTPTGYRTGIGENSTRVLATGATMLLNLSVAANQSVISPSGTTGVRFNVTSSGVGVANATVTLDSPGAGWWFPGGPLLTNSQGLAWSTLTAPSNINTTTSVLVYATVSKAGYPNGSGATAVSVTPSVPTGTPRLGMQASPLVSSLTEGTSVDLVVTVFNASSGPSQLVNGATVRVSPSTASLGAFNQTVESTYAGKAYFRFTAGTKPGTLIAEFNASAAQYLNATSSVAVSILAPEVPILSVTAHVPLTATPGSAIPVALHGYELNPATGAVMDNAADAVVNVSFEGNSQASRLSLTKVMLNSSGENSSLVVTAGLSSTAYLLQLSYSISLSGAATGDNTSSVAIVPPPLVVTTEVAPSLVFGQSGVLTAGVSDQNGTPLAGATVVLDVSPSSALALQNTTLTTGANGLAVFHFTVTSSSPVSNLSVNFHVTASAAGYAPSSNSTQAYVSSGSTSASSPTTYFGLSLVSWILLLLVILLLLALLAVLSRRKGATPTTTERSIPPKGASRNSSKDLQAQELGSDSPPQSGKTVPPVAPPAATPEEWSEEEVPEVRTEEGTNPTEPAISNDARSDTQTSISENPATPSETAPPPGITDPPAVAMDPPTPGPTPDGVGTGPAQGSGQDPPPKNRKRGKR